jgi:hypothetical protein
MFKRVVFLILSSLLLSARDFYINSLGMGGVDISIGANSKSILLNPANIPLKKNIGVEFTNAIFLNSRSLDFLKELSSNDSKKISDLMNKNIGKSLGVLEDNFLSLYGTSSSYSWLIGLYNSVDGRFITHTGFGSIGAMESFIDRYTMAIGSFSKREESFRYGANIRAVTKYRTIHNYTIGEIIETNSLFDYFDNRYTKSKDSLAFDIGGVYSIDRFNFGASILDIGDTSFRTLGRVESSLNMGVSTKHREFLFGVDFIDILHNPIKDSFRFGVSRDIDEFTLSSGILNGNLTFGLDYRYSILNLSLNFYRDRYQFLLSLGW